MTHPTVAVNTIDKSVSGLALVGPPAAGKSIVRRLLSDMGVETVDVTNADRAEGSGTNPRGPDDLPEWSKECLKTAAKTGGDIGVFAVEGLRDDEEIEWVNQQLHRDLLVVRIDTHNDSKRLERYIERELESDQNIVNEEEIHRIRDDFHRTEYEQLPYPTHHCSIYNDNSVSTAQLAARLQGIVQAISATPIDDDILGVA